MHWFTHDLPYAGKGLPRRQYNHRGHIRQLLEFGVDPRDKPNRCAWCGCKNLKKVNPRDPLAWQPDSVNLHRCFPGPRFIMDGYVGVCDHCLPLTIADHKTESHWPGVWILTTRYRDPIQVYVYRFANDWRVLEAIRQIWGTVPYRHRRKMRDYLFEDARKNDDGLEPVAQGRLRIEVLPAWPSWARNAWTVNMAQGHVIRLTSTVVRRMDDSAFAALVAHELAHTYQKAAGLMFNTQEKCEASARGIAARWGFPNEDMGKWTTQY